MRFLFDFIKNGYFLLNILNHFALLRTVKVFYSHFFLFFFCFFFLWNIHSLFLWQNSGMPLLVCNIFNFFFNFYMFFFSRKSIYLCFVLVYVWPKLVWLSVSGQGEREIYWRTSVEVVVSMKLQSERLDSSQRFSRIYNTDKWSHLRSLPLQNGKNKAKFINVNSDNQMGVNNN